MQTPEKPKVVILTQEIIDAEKDTWCDPLEDCQQGDKAVWSDQIPRMAMYEPFLVGAARLIAWIEQAEQAGEDARYIRKLRQAVSKLS